MKPIFAPFWISINNSPDFQITCGTIITNKQKAARRYFILAGVPRLERGYLLLERRVLPLNDTPILIKSATKADFIKMYRACRKTISKLLSRHLGLFVWRALETPFAELLVL